MQVESPLSGDSVRKPIYTERRHRYVQGKRKLYAKQMTTQSASLYNSHAMVGEGGSWSQHESYASHRNVKQQLGKAAVKAEVECSATVKALSMPSIRDQHSEERTK